jgi:hypothetical protein
MTKKKEEHDKSVETEPDKSMHLQQPCCIYDYLDLITWF